MGTTRYDAVIAGYLGVDVICDFTSRDFLQKLKPGKLLEMEDIGFTLGGVVANTGMAMKRFEKSVYLNGLLGEDQLGKMAVDTLKKYGLAQGIRTTSKANTACGIVLAPMGVDRMFLEHPGCNQILDLSHIHFDIVAQSRLFHFGYPPLLRQFYINKGYQLAELFARVKQLGVLTSLDFSLPDLESESGQVDWLATLKATLPQVDIFVPSLEEAIQIVMPETYKELQAAAGAVDFIDTVSFELLQEVGKRLLDLGVKVLLIKLAHRGAYLVTGEVSSLSNAGVCTDPKWNNCELLCDAYPVDASQVKNASGAGDTAAAGFLTALLDDESPEVALKFATLAGRNNLYCFHIYEELSNWATMQREMDQEVKSIKEVSFFN